MINPPLRLLAATHDLLQTSPEYLVAVPGREMWAAAIQQERHAYTLIVPDLDARTTFDNRSAKRKQTTRNRPLPRWARYPAGALLLLNAEQLTLPGVKVVIIGHEPLGPRYEYTLGMVFMALLFDHNEQDYDAQRLVRLMEQVQRDYLDSATS